MFATSFSSPKTKLSLSNNNRSNIKNDNESVVTNASLYNKIVNNKNNNDQTDQNSTLSNIIDVINENNLNIFYDNDTSNFKHNIDQLSLKFYLETEKIISSNNIKEKNISSNKLFIILFKQINLYISEIERLNTIILKSKRDPGSIAKKLAVMDRQKTDFETKEQIIQTLKYANKTLEKKLANLLESENVLRQQNTKLLEEKNFYYEYFINNSSTNTNNNINSNNFNKNKIFKTETNINTNNINLFKKHRRIYSLQTEDCLNNLSSKNKNFRGKNNNIKTNYLLNSDTFKHTSTNIALKSYEKNENSTKQKNNQSGKKDNKKNIYRKNKNNLKSFGSKNSKLKLQINDNECNNEVNTFTKMPLFNYTNPKRYQTTVNNTIKEEDYFLVENNYLNSIENLLTEIKNHLEIKNMKRSKNSSKNNRNNSIKASPISKIVKS